MSDEPNRKVWIRWSRVLLPATGSDAVEYRTPLMECFPGNIRVRSLPLDDRAVPLPQGLPRRTLSRTGVLLALACHEAREALAPVLREDPFAVGFYCALEPGPVDFKAARLMAEAGDAFAEVYRAQVNPLSHFHFLPSLPPAHLLIYLGIQGRMTVFTDSRGGGRKAWNQACADLRAGRVRAALVCSAFSFENPFLVLREAGRVPAGGTLCESASALVLSLEGDQDKTDGHATCRSGDWFGAGHELIERAMGRNACANNQNSWG